MTLSTLVRSKFPNLVLNALTDKGDEVVHIRREGLKGLAAELKSSPEFQLDMLMDIFAVDYLHWEEKEIRFEVIYNLYSSTKQHRLFLKAPVPETDASIDSVTAVWPAADWFEREVWDMMGIVFKDHPNLKRLLMYEEFKGHALRKDYPTNKRQPLVGPLG